VLAQGSPESRVSLPGGHMVGYGLPDDLNDRFTVHCGHGGEILGEGRVKADRHGVRSHGYMMPKRHDTCRNGTLE
jgi:hypothetical protein